jgi:hypothetical protein
MRKHDLWTSLFWIAFALYVCIDSIHLGIGTLRKPGMGFILFGASILLGVLSVALLLRTVLAKETSKRQPLFAGTMWRQVVFILASLLVYAKVMPWAGYLISTFVLMGLLFWIVEKKKLWWPLIMSFTTTIITYYLFSVLLKGEFPRGFLGF